MLAHVGIDASSDDVTQLTLDKSKLEKALNANPDSVKLMFSDGYTNDGDTGILDGLLRQVNNVLDTTSGYFSSKASSFETEIKTLNNRIDRANERLLSYQTSITNKFNRMDTLISNLNSQLSTFQSYFA